MSSWGVEWIKSRNHETAYDRTVVIGDLHGDLQALLASLAEKRVVRFSGSLNPILRKIQTSLGRSFSAGLEAMVIRQTAPLQMVFLGDLFDRWNEGCQIAQFLMKIRWERFNIEPVFILGNHDIHNFHFFVNPFRIYDIYSESELPQKRRLEYLGSMGLAQSLESFLALHRDEIMAIQKRFYRTGILEWDLGYGKLTLSYSRDYSFLTEMKGSFSWEQLCRRFALFSKKLGFEPDRKMETPIDDFLNHLGRCENPGGQNWWSIQAPVENGAENDGMGYSRDLLYFNLFTQTQNEKDPRSGKKSYDHILLVDWRVISLVWRKHYGSLFRRFKQMHLEGDTLYVHGGLSPRVMMDSHAFGIIYRIGDQEHMNIQDVRNYSVDHVVDRCNRLSGQVMENCLNDYSFQRFCGTEIFDGMGVWRSVRYGFTQFGCVFWADFEYLRRELRHENIRNLYERFVEATGITRVICGHTRFWGRNEETRYLMIRELEKLGMDYLCVDNSCSRGYSGESKLTGLEINAMGRILNAGRYDE